MQKESAVAMSQEREVCNRLQETERLIKDVQSKCASQMNTTRVFQSVPRPDGQGMVLSQQYSSQNTVQSLSQSSFSASSESNFSLSQRNAMSLASNPSLNGDNSSGTNEPRYQGLNTHTVFQLKQSVEQTSKQINDIKELLVQYRADVGDRFEGNIDQDSLLKKLNMIHADISKLGNHHHYHEFHQQETTWSAFRQAATSSTAMDKVIRMIETLTEEQKGQFMTVTGRLDSVENELKTFTKSVSDSSPTSISANAGVREEHSGHRKRCLETYPTDQTQNSVVSSRKSSRLAGRSAPNIDVDSLSEKTLNQTKKGKQHKIPETTRPQGKPKLRDQSATRRQRPLTRSSKRSKAKPSLCLTGKDESSNLPLTRASPQKHVSGTQDARNFKNELPRNNSYSRTGRTSDPPGKASRKRTSSCPTSRKLKLTAETKKTSQQVVHKPPEKKATKSRSVSQHKRQQGNKGTIPEKALEKRKSKPTNRSKVGPTTTNKSSKPKSSPERERATLPKLELARVDRRGDKLIQTDPSETRRALCPESFVKKPEATYKDLRQPVVSEPVNSRHPSASSFELQAVRASQSHYFARTRKVQSETSALMSPSSPVDDLFTENPVNMTSQGTNSLLLDSDDDDDDMFVKVAQKAPIPRSHSTHDSVHNTQVKGCSSQTSISQWRTKSRDESTTRTCMWPYSRRWRLQQNITQLYD